MRLYRSAEHHDQWIGPEIADGPLMIWPARPKGWLERAPFGGRVEDLDEVPAASARGTRWPGAGVGRPPRSAGTPSAGKPTLRATAAELEAWRRAAGTEPLSTWARRTLNEAARGQG